MITTACKKKVVHPPAIIDQYVSKRVVLETAIYHLKLGAKVGRLDVTPLAAESHEGVTVPQHQLLVKVDAMGWDLRRKVAFLCLFRRHKFSGVQP